jgi:NAD(P)-dependent dehydrogenase (short-subunit alcohol dehydrogenase family)
VSWAPPRTISKSKDLKPSPDLVLVDGEVSKKETAVKVLEAALKHFGRIDLLVNNAGIFIPKAFTDYTEEDSKGQTVIPAEIRKRHALTAQSRLAWIDDGSSIRVVPLPEGPRKYGRGIAKGMRLSERLLAERAKDKKSEQARRSP